MTERDDIDVAVSNNATIPDDYYHEKVSLFIYDKYEGGLGYSEKIYGLVPEILYNAIRMVKGCPCEDGCPACVGDYTLDKGMILWGLENLLEETEAPEYVRKNIKEPHPAITKEFSFFELPEKWQSFCAAVLKNGESGGRFLKTVKAVGVEEHKLILTVENAFYAGWIQEAENRKSLENILRYYAICPGDMKIEVILENRQGEKEEKEQERKKARLQRKYDEQLGKKKTE